MTKLLSKKQRKELHRATESFGKKTDWESLLVFGKEGQGFQQNLAGIKGYTHPRTEGSPN